MSGSPRNAFQLFGSTRHSTHDAAQRSFVATFARLGDFYKNDVFTDVTFVVGQSTFKAHKVVLCCHSPVFEAMFTAGMTEARNGRVSVDDIKPRIFGLLLDYLYAGTTPTLDTDDTVELFVAADKYGIASLSAVCENLLIQRITSNNVVEMFLMAENFKRAALKKRAYRYMRLCMEDVVKTEGWSLIADNAAILRRIVTANTQRAEQVNSLLYSFKKNSIGHRTINKCSPWLSYSWKLEDSLRPNQFIFPSPKIDKKVYIVLDSYTQDNEKILSANAFVETRLDVPFKLYVKCYFHRRNEEDENVKKVNFQEGIFSWIASSAHPTLGNPRMQVYRSVIPKDVDTFKCELTAADEAFEKELAQDPANPRFLPIQTVEMWRFQPSNSLEDTPTCSVHSETLPADLTSGFYPPRDQVTLELLREARLQGLDHLVLYLEHALVWDLDPYNVLDRIEVGHELGLGFLKWGALQYFKMKSKRVIKAEPEKWEQLKPAMLAEILLETNRNMFPFYLPSFLVEVN